MEADMQKLKLKLKLKLYTGQNPFDVSKCFGVKVNDGRYAGIFVKGSELVVSQEITPKLGDKVAIRHKVGNYLDLAVYQSEGRVQLIDATHSESKNYPPDMFEVLGVVIGEITWRCTDGSHLLESL